MAAENSPFESQVEAIRREFEDSTASLAATIEKLHARLVREEQKFAALRQAMAEKVTALVETYAVGSMPLSTVVQPAPSVDIGARARKARDKNGGTKRNALDTPTLVVAVELSEHPDNAEGGVTGPQVTDELQRRHPELDANRSTVRNALERHVRAGLLRVVKPGGRGSANPTIYGPKT